MIRFTAISKPGIERSHRPGYGVCYAPSHQVQPESAVVRCLSDLLTVTPVETNLDFSFYAGISH
eukprot:scaffold298108_cov32-Tisochrysis_lutea.AAC.1